MRSSTRGKCGRAAGSCPSACTARSRSIARPRRTSASPRRRPCRAAPAARRASRSLNGTPSASHSRPSIAAGLVEHVARVDHRRRPGRSARARGRRSPTCCGRPVSASVELARDLAERREHLARLADQEAVARPGPSQSRSIRQQVVGHVLLVADRACRRAPGPSSHSTTFRQSVSLARDDFVAPGMVDGRSRAGSGRRAARRRRPCPPRLPHDRISAVEMFRGPDHIASLSTRRKTDSARRRDRVQEFGWLRRIRLALSR